jgi:hypothetical protein
VSDEFTVPLCAIHHHQIHTTGKEREWWQERKIDPLTIAQVLWQQSRERDSFPPRVDRGQAKLLGGGEAETKHQASPSSTTIGKVSSGALRRD